ncbi:hypothetical protein [Bradyrhizobium sp. USDA 10063]
MADDPLRMMKSEFDLWGVKFEHRTRGSGHIEIRWQVSPYKPVRSHVMAKTPSDHRWFLNERARVRQLFRQDGLTPPQDREKKAAPVGELEIPRPIGNTLEKALQIPPPVETDRDLLKSMRAEIAVLTDLVLQLLTTIPAPATPAVAPEPTVPVSAEPTPVEPAPAVVVEAPANNQPFRRVDILACVCDGWNSLEAIAKAAGIPAKFAYRKLYYLQQKGELETSEGRWRRKPKPKLELVTGRATRPPAKAKPKNVKLTGKRKATA